MHTKKFRIQSKILFLVCAFLAAFTSAAAAESPTEAPVDAAAEVAPDKKPLSWNEKRAHKLEEVRKARKRSKNIRATRQLIEETAGYRSHTAAELLGSGRWQHVSGDHAYLFYEDADRDVAAALSGEAEEIIKRVKSYTNGVVPEDSLAIEIYLVRSEAFWNAQQRVNTFHPNDFSNPTYGEIFLNAGKSDTHKTALAHHATHLLLRHYVDTRIRSGAPLPLWLDEGLAMFLSRGKENQAAFAEKIKQDHVLSLVDILRTNNETMEEATAFQTETGALVTFITQHTGAEEFTRLINILFTSGIPYAYATDAAPTTERARAGFVFLIESTGLKKDFASFETFEAAWLDWGKSPPSAVAEAMPTSESVKS